MKRLHGPIPYINPWFAGVQLALASTQLMTSSAEVIGLRVNRMLLAGPRPTARDRSEMARMGPEKVTAGMASFQAMFQGWMELNGQLMALAVRQALVLAPMMFPAMSFNPAHAQQARILATLLSGSAQTQARIATAVPRIAGRGLKPIQTRTRANVRRLRAR